MVITKDIMEQINVAKDLLIANPWTHKYFWPNSIETQLDHQVAIYFQYNGVDCKALLDGVLINHKDKTLQPFDLKTTGKSVNEFPHSFMEFGYYRQCAFYEQAILSEQSPYKALLDQGYQVLDYLFIVTETTPKSTRAAIIYEIDKQDRIVGLQGGYVEGRHYPGIDSLIEDFKWHNQTQQWDLPRTLYENKGKVKLKLFNNE